ncbi:hypothetical protein MMC30_004367 [Trapelia coarctata]|nr:hypothetical protein [Trapelia coarctata]
MNNSTSTSNAETAQSSPTTRHSSMNNRTDRDQTQQSEQRRARPPQYTNEFAYEVAPTFEHIQTQGFSDFTETLNADSIEFNDLEDPEDPWSTTHLLKSPVQNTLFPLQPHPSTFAPTYRGSTASSASGDLFSAGPTNTTATSTGANSRNSDDERRSPPSAHHTNNTNSPVNSNKRPLVAFPVSNLNPCDCFTDILDTLAALQRYCKTPAAPLHVALTVNKEAMERCRTILGCPCTQEDNCITLLSVVISRILFLYRLAAKGYFSPLPPLSTSSTMCKRPQSLSISTQPGASTTGASSTDVLPARLVFGTYEVEGEDERRVSKEIVMIAVTKVDGLIKGLVDLVQGMQEHPSVGLYRCVSEHLLKEFGSTVESIRGWH